MADTGWRDRAACLGKDPRIFFPVSDLRGRRNAAKDAAVAAIHVICDPCPVKDECELEGVGKPGFWGGKGTDERKTAALGTDACRTTTSG